MSTEILTLERVTKRFGGLTAIGDLSFSLHEGEILSLIGPNGAGKSTVFNLITGVYQPTEGSIRFQGNSVLRKAPHQIAHMGLARTFQNIRLFANSPALENVAVGHHMRLKSSFMGAILRTPGFRAEEARVCALAEELLALVGLSHRAQEVAKNLSYGEQRRLEIARALATMPKALLLDEPAAGMNEKETADLLALIRRIRERGVTVILIEHDMPLVMEISDRIVVLNFGQKIAEGKPAQIQADPKVIEAYLGTEEEA